MCQTYKLGFVKGLHSGSTKKPWPSKVRLFG